MTSPRLIAEAARLITDSNGTFHGKRDVPNICKFRRLCGECGITDWRDAWGQRDA